MDWTSAIELKDGCMHQKEESGRSDAVDGLDKYD